MALITSGGTFQKAEAHYWSGYDPSVVWRGLLGGDQSPAQSALGERDTICNCSYYIKYDSMWTNSEM